MVYEVGDLLAETERFPDGPRRSVADVDLMRIRQDRLRQGTFDDNRRTHDAGREFRTVAFELTRRPGTSACAGTVDRFPFVPDDAERLALDCYEAYNIQVSGLAQRLRAIGDPKIVIGVSGGLDSTHAADRGGQGDGPAGPPAQRHPRVHDARLRHQRRPPRTTPPGCPRRSGSRSPSSTSGRRRCRCWRTSTTRSPTASRSTTSRSRTSRPGLRTDYLFRLANHRGGIVLGTGDLSELALGWCTYGVGDQMSHYAVNAGVPKTLIQHLIRWVIATGRFDEETNAVLEVIVGQEISPSSSRSPRGSGRRAPRTSIGPYALQDFTLFHVLRYGFPPSRIAFLARHAWA